MTHHEDCDSLQQQHRRALVQHHRIFVQDGHVATSAGVTAGIDLALHLNAHYAGPDVASRGARKLVVHVRRVGADAQLSPWFAYRSVVVEVPPPSGRQLPLHVVPNAVRNLFRDARMRT